MGPQEVLLQVPESCMLSTESATQCACLGPMVARDPLLQVCAFLMSSTNRNTSMRYSKVALHLPHIGKPRATQHRGLISHRLTHMLHAVQTVGSLRLALHVLVEAAIKGGKSRWAPYLSILPPLIPFPSDSTPIRMRVPLMFSPYVYMRVTCHL